MLYSKNLETNKTSEIKAVENREEGNLINPEYLSLMYNSMYQVGQCYVCINDNHENWGKVSEKVSRNKGLSEVDIYDKNMSLIGQYNTEDDTISYIFPDDDRGYEQLIMSLQRKQTVEDNYLIIINLNSHKGLILHNRQKISDLVNVGYKNYQNKYTSDFWQHALGIGLIDLDCLYSNRSISERKEASIEIIINIETLKVLGVFKKSYYDCRGNEYITTMDNNHVRSGISFSISKDGIQTIEHKSNGSQLNIKKFDTIENLFGTYKPLLHDWRDKDIEYGYESLGCTADEKYFKFRGPLQSDNRLRKPGDFIEIEKRSLYIEDRVLNLLNIDGKKLSIETTSREQKEIVEAFRHEQTASDQCPVYIKQKEKNILVIVQNNTVIIGRLIGAGVTDTIISGEDMTGQCMTSGHLMLWHKFKIEYAFRNKIVNNVGLMYTWKFLKDYIKLQDEVYLCIEEYNSIQKQTSTILLYNIQTGEAIADKDKIIQLRKEFFKKIDRYSDRRGQNWMCLRKVCSTAWDPRCDSRTTLEKRHDLYKTGGWNLVYQD